MKNAITLQLTPTHRVGVVTLIILQYLLFGWTQLLLVNYHSMRLPFLDQSSLLQSQDNQTHYTKNILLYALFWVQHIVMATLKYKITWFKKLKYFALYDRYIYNVCSGLALWFIFDNLEPTFIPLFTIPLWICLPICLPAAYMLIRSMWALGGSILMPFKLSQILTERQVVCGSYEEKGKDGLKQDGIYNYVRHPMQGAVLFMLVFGNGIYTTDRLLFVGMMIAGVIVGVLMQERRMLIQFKEYGSYMEKVKSRFVPFIPL